MLALLLLACAHHPGKPSIEASIEGVSPSVQQLSAAGVTLAPTVVVRDLPAPPLPPAAAPGIVEEQLENAALPAPTQLDPERDAAFLRGDYVGNVRFGGGVIRTGDVALNARARLLEFNQQDVDATQGVAWLHDAVADVLTARTVAYTPSTAPVQPTVERVPVRGMHPDDGTDNQNLPRSELRPGALPADPAAPTRYVLVPMLRQYYTHNGGWFIGQQYGCMAGARVEALVVLYDTHTGAPVWWMDAVGRHIDGDTATPSSAQLDQYLLWAEDDVELALAKKLLP